MPLKAERVAEGIPRYGAAHTVSRVCRRNCLACSPPWPGRLLYRPLATLRTDPRPGDRGASIGMGMPVRRRVAPGIFNTTPASCFGNAGVFMPAWRPRPRPRQRRHPTRAMRVPSATDGPSPCSRLLSEGVGRLFLRPFFFRNTGLAYVCACRHPGRGPGGASRCRLGSNYGRRSLDAGGVGRRCADLRLPAGADVADLA